MTIPIHRPVQSLNGRSLLAVDAPIAPVAPARLPDTGVETTFVFPALLAGASLLGAGVYLRRGKA